MSCAGRNHLAKRSEATRDFTDTNWDGEFEESEKLAIVEADLGNGVLKVHNLLHGVTAEEQKQLMMVAQQQEENNNTTTNGPIQVQLPGKFHKLIWFMRLDIIVHDGSSVVRKVSDEQLRRLSKEKPDSLFVLAWELQASRKDRRPEEEKEKDILDRRPNWAARVVHSGFTSSDDDEGEGEEAEEEQGDE
jgi:hypothetical protein